LNGAAIGTSMGMSPQSGLPQNNRVGDLDAEAVPYALKALGLSVDEAQRQLSKEAGLKGLSGVSNDIREIQEAAAQGNAAARMAIDVFVASARHWIGSYLFELNGADALVFTAGIGENRAELRAAICANLDQLGVVLDAAKNKSTAAQEALISAPGSKVKVFVIPTNEELVVAREVKRFLESTDSKSEIRKTRSASPKSVRSGTDASAFGIRFSAFLRISDFGFRISNLFPINHHLSTIN
jgi:acetate kinase